MQPQEQKNNKKNIVAYSRVSTAKQKNEGTIEQQREIINSWVERHPEYEIVKWFEDDGQSGFDDERKAYKEMASFLANNSNVGGVIVRNLSRLGRDSFELQKFDKEVVQKLDKQLIMINLNIDTSTKEGKLIYTNMAALVEYQAEDIKERLKYAREREYKKHPEKFGRPRKIIPEILKKRMIKWYYQGNGFLRISKMIFAEDLKDYPDWFKKECPNGFGKGEYQYYVSPYTVRSRLRDWGVEIRDPKYRKNI